MPCPTTEQVDSVQIQAMLTQACTLHQAGQLTSAEALYAQVLEHVPQHADALHLSGLIAHARGDAERALAYLQQAVTSAPHNWAVHSNLGEVYRCLGRLEAAIQSHSQATRLHPEGGVAHFNLGLVQWQQQDLVAAHASFTRALQLAPGMPEAYVSLGRVCEAQGALAEASAAYEVAMRLAPGCTEAYHRAGVVWHMQGQHERALVVLDKARQLAPDNPEVYTNLGVVWQAHRDFDQALYCYAQALARRPDCAITHWNRALAYLTLGRLAPGWEAYEWRCRAKLPRPRQFPYPRWQGTALAGRTILVHSEQGIGDELLFATCLPDLLTQAGHVLVECDSRLVTLFRRSFHPATVRHTGDPALGTDCPVDVYCPIGSLPRYLRPTLGAFPRRAGYLVPDPLRLRHWQRCLASLGPGLRVGVSWRSRASRRQMPYYTALSQWGAVFSVPGIHWVNLQYDDYAAELAAVAQQWGVHVQHWPELDTMQDLDGVAALMAAVDVVIAPDTTAAQLAAGVGVPVWRLTMYEEDEMGLGSGVNPWGPTMRLFRQPRSGDWQSVLARLGSELAQLATAG